MCYALLHFPFHRSSKTNCNGMSKVWQNSKQTIVHHPYCYSFTLVFACAQLRIFCDDKAPCGNSMRLRRPVEMSLTAPFTPNMLVNYIDVY